MVTHTCERCNKIFTQKSHLKAHLNRKKPCENQSEKIEQLVNSKLKNQLLDQKLKNLINITMLVDPKSKSIMESQEIKDYKSLFDYLKVSQFSNIKQWLEHPWKGKDKQESLLRLFSYLGLVSKLKNFDICTGNFNEQSLKIMYHVNEIFYDSKNQLIALKDKGDSSDLTAFHATQPKTILATTSKNLNKENVDKLDIDKILTNFKPYEEQGYKLILCVVIRDSKSFHKMVSRIEKTNKKLKDLLLNPSTIIIDWDDINEAYYKFKNIYQNTDVDELIKDLIISPLILKMHQELGVNKTIKLKKKGKKNILWGQVQRSGKSYIMAGTIIEDCKNKTNCNYLIITTAPNETIEQYINVLRCLQLADFDIHWVNGKNKKPKLGNKNIIICSKQFLQYKLDDSQENEKIKSIQWMKQMIFEMRFLDESHLGGTTTIAQKILDYYGKLSTTIQITATYSKPIKDYDIPKESWILWDLEDIKLCRKINQPESLERLIEKHGSDFLEVKDKYSELSIIEEYSKYPDLWILTDRIEPSLVGSIIEQTKDNDYGWSVEAAFLLKQNEDEVIQEFQNPEENLKLWYRIFGKRNELGIPDSEYPDEQVYLKRIETICKNPEYNSRYLGHNDGKPMIIMAFLPQNNIDLISKASKKILIDNNVIPNFEIVIINSKVCGSKSKQAIEDGRLKAIQNGKQGVLVLSGRQCSLGVSIDDCDIVLMLNNNVGFDMIYQMMFRCMTEAKNKKCGFVIDPNLQRVIDTCIIDYGSIIKPGVHPKDAIKYILQEQLINLNSDHWIPSFGNSDLGLNNIADSIYEIYSSNTEKALKHFLNRLKFKDMILNKDENIFFKTAFNQIKPTKEQQQIFEKILNDDNLDGKIKPGIKKIVVQGEPSSDTEESEPVEKQINYMEILKYIIPLICILTIHYQETSFVEMYEHINSKPYIYDILIEQTQSWWGDKINSNILKKFIQIYNKYLCDDADTNQIIRTVKELFQKNISNQEEMSNLIDQYLIPTDLEKKDSAEVSTPHVLRIEMIDSIPDEFWTVPHKVFEPCSGKGGFLINIISKFMIGLKDLIPDEKERHKFIVENCLYWADINPTNIFIGKLLIDPYNDYKLNCYQGNTLELDIKEQWDLDGFDAVIGNPPYNDKSDNKGAGHKLWDKFMEFGITKWLVKDGYLLYVHPPLWRQPENKLFKLMKKNNLIYLEIHNYNDGKKMFKCSTRYDWYLMQKSTYLNQTTIVDEFGVKSEINLNQWDFIPNGYLQEIRDLITGDEKHEFISDRSNYGADKSWVSKTQNDEFQYPVVYSLYKDLSIQFRYSKHQDSGHFGVPKIIFTPNLGLNHIIDTQGEYGLTQWVVGIVDEPENLEQITKIFSNHKFQEILKSIKFGMYYNTKILKMFKKDFWTDFV
jgi:hypothetical protein